MKYYHWFPFHPTNSEFTGDKANLKEIGKNLFVVNPEDEDRKKQTDLKRISSVPDIWSQHQLFHMMLTNTEMDDSYLEYEEIVAREWRAMFAVLLLADSYDVKIYMETIDFKKDAKNPYVSAAYKVRPKAEKWNSMDLYYIEDGDKKYPIAMSSPTVHIVPTKDAWEKLEKVYPGKIPWLRDGKVHALVNKAEDTESETNEEQKTLYKQGMIQAENGKERPAIMQIHALVLKQWLDYYGKKTAKNTLLINGVINDYSNALKSAYHLDANNMPDISGVVKGYDMAPMQINQVPVPKTFKMFSDVVYYAAIEIGAGYKELTDAHKYAGGLGEECLKTLHHDKEYDQYFIPMPVTEMFWTLWDENKNLKPEYKVEIASQGDRGVLSKIEATVTIGGIAFSHTYEGEKAARDVTWDEFCTSGVWPRQRIAGWSKYSMFSVENNGYALIPDDEAGIREKIEHRKANLTYYMLKQMPNRCKFVRNQNLLGYVTTRKTETIGAATAQQSGSKGNKASSSLSGRVYRASLDFGTSSTTMCGGTSKGVNNLISGLNLWSMPLIDPYGIYGEGTQNGALYFVPAMPLSPKALLLEAQDHNDVLPSYADIVGNKDIQEKILPSIPLQSILADAIDRNTSRQPLFHSWIYYRPFLTEYVEFDWPKLCPNLKWSMSGDADKKRVEAMLAQLLYMIALEARCNDCEKLLLTASYPLTFKEEIVQDYFGALNSVLEQVAGNTGLTIEKPEKPKHTEDATEDATEDKDDAEDSQIRNTEEMAGNVIKITESEAAFRYISAKEKQDVTYCVIDIGGGSADLFVSALKDGNKSYYSSSIRFGARKILLEGLLNKDAGRLKILIKKLDNLGIGERTHIDQDITDYAEKYNNGQRQDAESSIENILSTRTHANKNFDTHVLGKKTFGDACAQCCAASDAGNLEEVSLMDLKKRMAFYLAAIIFCTGLMIRGQADLYKNRATVLLAGNGSKMIHWLHLDTKSKTEFVNRMLQAGIDKPITSKGFQCIFSDDPKLEVAKGSLLDGSAIFGDGPSTIQRIWFDDRREITCATRRSAAVADYVPVVAAGESEFLEFIDTYREVCEDCFGWSFASGAYSAKLFGENGDEYLKELLKKFLRGKDVYLLGAVDALSQYYLERE